MTKAEIEAANETVLEMRRMIQDVRTVAIAEKNDYAEGLIGVVSDCLARIQIEPKKRK